MYTIVPFEGDDSAQAQAEHLHKELVENGLSDQLPKWGKIWVREGKVICIMPSHPFDEFNAPPLVFIDETLDLKRQIFFLGALIFRSAHAIVAVARHIQNLVVLAEAHPKFWLPNAPPPRLHLRELNHFAAKLKTPWKHVPRMNIELLFKTFVPSIREMSGLRLIAPVSQTHLLKSIRNIAPQTADAQLQQVTIQLAATQLRAMLADSKLSVDKLEIIPDYDRSAISLGTSSRQATLHLLDALAGAKALTPLPQELIWNKDARYSSKFPNDFSLRRLQGDGYPLRALVESVGLQFVDVYLGLWRTINSEKRPHFGISSDDLGVQVSSNMVWVS